MVLWRLRGRSRLSSPITPAARLDPIGGFISTRIVPQPGPQTQFLSSPADIAIYGGAAGGGKTFALLLEFLRHIKNPEFGAVIFRRTAEQIRIEGGLWDIASQLYPALGARGRENRHDWTFPTGARITFDSIQHEKDKLAFQGAQICGLGFDELTHFTESQFFYLLSRNRSTCGVRPYVRATTNPDANSWVKPFLGPWISAELPAADGELRYFIRDGGQIRWVPKRTKFAKSVTFIRAKVTDNPALLRRDPGYLANLKSLSLVDRRRLLDGDWEAVEGGDFFQPGWFSIVELPPAVVDGKVRFWDLAGTEAARNRGMAKDPDWTVGLLLSRLPEGRFTVEDVKRVQLRALGVEQLVLRTAEMDGQSVPVRMEQEPGSSGLAVIDRYRRLLAGWDFQGVRSTGAKAERAKPVSAQAEAGHVQLVRAPWNSAYLAELSAFPSPGAHDDQVDATSGAFRELIRRRVIELAFN